MTQMLDARQNRTYDVNKLVRTNKETQMEILTEFDELQAALAKVNMDECVLPYLRGRLVSESAFNKTQKILNCPEMISAHKYLYNLDLD